MNSVFGRERERNTERERGRRVMRKKNSVSEREQERNTERERGRRVIGRKNSMSGRERERKTGRERGRKGNEKEELCVWARKRKKNRK